MKLRLRTKVRIKKSRVKMAVAAAFLALTVLAGGTCVYANTDEAYAETQEGGDAQTAETAEETAAETEAAPAETSADAGSDSENADAGGGARVIAEEEADGTESPFTTAGNGDLGDEVLSSGEKDFYTIHTKNNNTYYLVIDHSGSTDNVYMLSMIDENDLAEFLSEAEETEESASAVVLPEEEETVTPVISEEESEEAAEEEAEEKEEESQSPMALIVLAVLGIAAAGYYFKVYRPRHTQEEVISENMEDGLATENEDEESEE